MKALRSLPRPVRAAVVIVTAGLLLSGCVSATVDSMSELGHVHGISANASTGTTYVATHNGVWKVDSSYLTGDKSHAAPQQIGGQSQDTMGFTVTESGLMFASGHPDPANNSAQSPPNLGLIQSRDSAATWKTVSLGGQTDFHDLVTVPGKAGDASVRIYGYDAARQTVVISDSAGMDWQDGAVIALRKLAVNERDPDIVYATTESGLKISSDAGRSFVLVPDAPSLLLIDAINETPKSFVGVDTDNVIWTTDDGAKTWQQRGKFDTSPEALAHVTGATEPWLVGTDRRGIVATPDYGKTWTILLARQP